MKRRWYMLSWFRKLFAPLRPLRNLPRPTVRLLLEPLEERWLPSTFIVTDNSDTIADPNSFRYALSNLAPGGNTINFAITGSTTIAVLSPLPAITQQVNILGFTQGGDGYTGPPLVVLNGASAGGGSDGLDLKAGSSGSEVQGLVIQQFGNDGIVVNGTSGNLIVGNFIGTDVHGTATLGNTNDGVVIGFGATANTVGGTAAGAANVISGNGRDGVLLADSGTSGNVVLGNKIGTDVNGTATLGNAGNGVLILSGATANTVGGTASGAANVISGNSIYGVYLVNSGTSGNVVLGNRIGTDVNGTANLGNTGDGVAIESGATANTVGGTASGAANVISGNGVAGVFLVNSGTSGNVVLGNRIGTDVNGTANLGNTGAGIGLSGGASLNTIGGTVPGSGNIIAFNSEGVVLSGSSTVQDSILGNSIFSNTGLGIDLGSPPGNHNQASPTLSSAFPVSGATTVNGTLTSSTGTYRLEFFASPASGPAAQGQTFLGFASVTVPGGGSTAFSASGLPSLPPSSVVTATATNVDGGSLQGDTSAFSAGVIPGGNFIVTDTSDDPNDPHSLRYALDNLVASSNTIKFAIPGSGPQTIVVGSFTGMPLPAIQFQVDVEGYTQGGSGYNGPPLIVINGAVLSGTPNGLDFERGSSGSEVQGMVIQGFMGNGIFFNGTSGNLVVGNYVGTNAAGSAKLGNAGNGIDFNTGSTANTVGGTTTGSGNVISGNGANGVYLRSGGTSGNVVLGNRIGTDVNGTATLGNSGDGVRFSTGATANTVGGTASGAANVISGNGLNGVYLRDSGTSGNVVLSNKIGTDVNGTAKLGNSFDGVVIGSGATANTVGGTASGAANVISGNDKYGVFLFNSGTSGNVVLGNKIGTDVNGTAKLGNSNDGVDIRAGATANTVGGTASGAANVISGNDVIGVVLSDSGTAGNVVLGNRIGTDVNGTAKLGNGSDGVGIFEGATANTIGGTASGSGNVISGNKYGVILENSGTSGNVVLGNFIGTDVNGTAKFGNAIVGVGIAAGATANTIGGTASGSGNVISANGDGVILENSGTSGNVVLGNKIGTDVNGTAKLGNTFEGVLIAVATANTIGGTASGAANVISANAVGVEIGGSVTGNTVTGNLIGTDLSGTLALGNTVGMQLDGSGDVIDQTTAPALNTIEANTVGVELSAGASANQVLRLRLGTNAAGTTALALPNGTGLLILGHGNTVGGTAYTGSANVISGNSSTGLEIQGSGATGNLVQFNFVGTDVNGTAALGNGGDGVLLDQGANANTIGSGNVLSANSGHSVEIKDAGTSGNVVLGNKIGTDVNGTAKLGNADGVGIELGATANTVGGTASGAANLISGNGRFGVFLVGGGTSGNVVLGNMIGTDVNGTATLGNGNDGVLIGGGATANTVGGTATGTATGAANVISGNGVAGVYLYGSGASGNVVLGNLIGTDVNGTANLGNTKDGVVIRSGATANTVGGTAAGAANVISGNGVDGVHLYGSGASGNVVLGNLIGTDKSGSASLGNAANGVAIENGSTSNTVGGTTAAARNVLSGNGQNGVEIAGAATSGNLVEGNFVGVDASGLHSLLHQVHGRLLGQVNGVEITSAPNNTIGSAPNNTIGGSALGAGNLLSGNERAGVSITSFLAIPVFNSPSTSAGGALTPGTYYYVLTALGTVGETSGSNQVSILTSAADATVNLSWLPIPAATGYVLYRGTSPGQENVIVATLMGENATSFSDAGGPTTPGTPPTNNTASSGNASGNLVLGNFLGTDKNGTAPVGNVFNGVTVNQASNNTIGGTATGARNIISGNGGEPATGTGIALQGLATTGTLIQGNYIGVDVSGTARLGNNANGIDSEAGASNNTIGGTASGASNVISRNFYSAIQLGDTDDTVIQGNLIGTDKTGTIDLGNGSAGILVQGQSQGNTIGYTTVAGRNVISGNGFSDPFAPPGAGVMFTGTGVLGNVVEGNFIGTDVTGTVALGNKLAGIAVVGGPSGNTLGGSATGAGNVISGNAGFSGIFGDGVILRNATGNVVQGNLIGTTPSGTAALANNGDGVYLFDGAAGNTLDGNVISGNSQDGVRIQDATSNGNLILGNQIGTNALGTAPVPNAGNGVSIYNASSNTLGGNVLSGNGGQGVLVTSLLPPPLQGGPTWGPGGALAPGTYYYVITALTVQGETTASNEQGVVVAKMGSEVVLGWAPLDGATGYKVYRGTAAGAENVLVQTIANGAIGSFIDDGSSSSPGMPPSSNTALDGIASANLIQGNKIGTDVNGTASLGNTGDGVAIVGATANRVGGTASGAANVISGNGRDGVVLVNSGTSGNVVLGNFIGTDVNGTTQVGTFTQRQGVALTGGATANTVGGTASGAANVISNNTNGVYVYGTGTSGNVVLGNMIGTDRNGTAPLGDANEGVFIGGGATANTLGGTAAGAGNVISDNQRGVEIEGMGTSANLVARNKIGTDIHGTANLGNFENGVFILAGASNNTVGGTMTGSGNIIAFNGVSGVVVGVSTKMNPSDSGTVRDSILGNSIFSNVSLGIDLGDDGHTANGTNPRPFPNDGQNAPVLTKISTSGGLTTIAGVLTSQTKHKYLVQFFTSDLSGPPLQGKTLFNALTLTVNTNGRYTFSFQVPALSPTQVVTATATDITPNNIDHGDTSEYSQLATTTRVTSSPTINVSSSAQKVTLTALVTSNGLPVTTGTVTFTIVGLPGSVTVNVDANGKTPGLATAQFTVPGGTPAGHYTIIAVYQGQTFASSSSDPLADGILTVLGNTLVGRRYNRPP